MKIVFVGLIVASISSNCLAEESIDLPSVKAGDTWTYRNTTERGPTGWNQIHDEITVARVTSSNIYYTSKQSGSTQPPREIIVGADWSRMRDVNGKETVVNQPLLFPLSPGETWEVTFTEQHPNKNHKLERWDNKFTAVNFEMVEVPAGKFNALKIEAEGRWAAEMEPTLKIAQGSQFTSNDTTMVTRVQRPTANTVTGRIYKAFWYVPEVKRWVKSVEEYYGNGGVRNERYMAELESFKLTD